jgi:hypothetical protein
MNLICHGEVARIYFMYYNLGNKNKNMDFITTLPPHVAVFPLMVVSILVGYISFTSLIDH